MLCSRFYLLSIHDSGTAFIILTHNGLVHSDAAFITLINEKVE